MRKNKWIMAAALGVVAMFGVSGAEANSVLITLVNTTPDGVNTDYNYQVRISQANQLRNGDGLVVFDFDGFAGFTNVNFSPVTAGTFALTYNTAPGTTLQIAPIGDSATAVALYDNPSIGNINLVYTGNTPTSYAGFSGFGTTTGVTSPIVSGQILLGSFTAVSSLPTVRGDHYYGQDHDSAALSLATQNSLEQVGVPGLPNGSESPLPAAVWGGMGLMGLVAGKKRLARKLA